MLPIKKLITGFTLILCFATSAFASNVTLIALELNECFLLIERMARYEYEYHVNCEFRKLRRCVDKKLISFNKNVIKDETDEIININKFINATIFMLYKFKENMLSDFKNSRIYEKIYSTFHKSSYDIVNDVAWKFESIFRDIYYYLKAHNGKPSEKEYFDFIKGFDDELLLPESDKLLLYHYLMQCSIDTNLTSIFSNKNKQHTTHKSEYANKTDILPIYQQALDIITPNKNTISTTTESLNTAYIIVNVDDETYNSTTKTKSCVCDYLKTMLWIFFCIN